MQREALLEGAKLANRLGDPGAGTYYQQKATALQAEIDKHKDLTRGCLIPTLDDPRPFDLAVILAVLHTDNSADDYLSAADEFVLGSANLLISGFDPNQAANADRFEITTAKMDRDGKPMGLGIGRYSADLYDGDDARARDDDHSKVVGNPWVLGTLAVGELGYRAAERIGKQTGLQVTDRNLRLLQRLDPSLTGLMSGVTLSPNQPEFKAVIQGLRGLGESQLRRTRFHANPDGSLSEQMNRRTGFMWGAPNLSWSHVSFVNSARRRNQP